MALELIGSLIAAAVFGLMVWALRRLVPAIPKWAISVAAFAGLIGTTIYLEYDWFNRVSAELPPGFAIVNAQSSGSPMRPWTYAVPMITQFAAVDTTKIAHHPTQPGMVIAPVFGFARWQAPKSGLMVFDCTGNRRVPITDGMNIDDAGRLTGADWVVLDTSDELQRAVCEEG